jgi:hypothetical protein
MKLRNFLTLACVTGLMAGLTASAQAAAPIWPSASFYTGFTGTNAQNGFKSTHLTGTGTTWAPLCDVALAFDDGSGFADACFEQVAPIKDTQTDTALTTTYRFAATTLAHTSNVVTFHINYKLQNRKDGVILEQKLDSGPWTEVTDAGDTFDVGGYDPTINAGAAHSAINGQHAWTGNSMGYTEQHITLAPVGSPNKKHYVQFRFRLVTDDSAGPANPFFRLDEFYYAACGDTQCP